MVRICISPYIIAIISTGEQRRIILIPLLEGVVNVFSSVLAGYYLGALGVALGTFVGAFVSASGNLLYTMRGNKGIQLGAGEYFLDSLLRPLLCALPTIALGLA